MTVFMKIEIARMVIKLAMAGVLIWMLIKMRPGRRNKVNETPEAQRDAGEGHRDKGAI